MARIGISITKSTSFRGATQEFSNTYYYENNGALPDAAGADALIDELTANEKTFHSNLVTFVRGRCWSQIGSKEQNEMISQKNLSGTGSTGTAANMDKERAFLFRRRAGVDSRGNPVYMRKWYHSCGVFVTGQTLSTALLENTSGFSQAQRDAQVNAMETVWELAAAGGGWSICSKNGRQTSSSVTSAHQYLEHHQLGDMWRAQ